MDNPPDSLHAYYTARGLSPTDCRFTAAEDLDRYAAGREILFRDRLHLPIALFDRASVIEIGPDTGENALVFARWGARLHLVEPNPQAHPRIRANFDRFGLGGQIETLRQIDLEHFEPGDPADVITAEGFIYTCRPVDPWMRGFAAATRPDGFVLLSYYEQCGAVLELVTKMLAARVRALTGEDSVTVADRLYGPKWATIGHTRRFESWVMDVLDNPFVRRSWFFSASALCRDMARHGFALHSAWPSYADGLSVHWHKAIPAPDMVQRQRDTHLNRSSISFLTGRPLYLAGEAGAVAGAVEAVHTVAQAVDQLVDAWDDAVAARACDMLDRLIDAVALTPVVTHDPQDIDLAIDLFRGLRGALASLSARDSDGVARFTRDDPAFLSLWGAPAHHAVFRRRRGGC